MKIGPMFPYELDAAGLIGLSISWDHDTGKVETVGLTREQLETLGNVIAAHDPAVQPSKDTLDTRELNAALMQNGTVTKALAEFVFRLSKGQIPIDPDRTVAQFRAILKGFM